MSHEVDPEARRPASQEVDFPLADTISLRTVVNLLLRKGVVTVEELLDEESRNLAWGDTPTAESPHVVKGRRAVGLKRLMSKTRVTRRLGTWLFGWRWKKVRIDTER
ncbi:MAG: hypothetical protein QHJ34_08445 [bacterium]|jgi:hypothetical protein|nr:hypothetical protein [candidate division KSB1 bacterium]MDH7560241.1 hypothetical protein [bacterium]